MPVFISHAMDDQGEYRQLVEALDREGIEHWDPKSMVAGGSLAEQLVEAINRCDRCVFLATPRSVKSHWCLAELGTFWGAGKKLVAFHADTTLHVNDLPPQLHGQLTATDVAGLIKALKNQALRDAAVHERTMLFMSGDSRDEEKRRAVRRALEQASDRDGACFGEVHTLGDLDDDQLSEWNGLFLGTPHQQRLTQRLIARLVEWVRAGGNLVMCGFELGDRHHKTNLNQLAYHFGLSFNSDIVVRAATVSEKESDYAALMKYQKGYDDPLRYDRFREPDTQASVLEGALLDGVQSLVLASVCSLHLEPGARPLVFVEPNMVKELTSETGRYSAPPDFELAPGNQIFDPPYADRRRTIAALAPKDLVLKGRVLALGSWDFGGGTSQNDNGRFLRNVLNWLKERRSKPY